jgi:type I restriction-modification system DNA methylase subunit
MDTDVNIDDRELVAHFTQLKLAPDDKRKRARGEVFTPDKLINEMLDKLPNEVWSKMGFKWFDPAVGVGNFMIQVYYRLMTGLEDKIPDENKRKEHILSSMLYMSEIDTDNVRDCRSIFGVGCNIYHGDTLSLDTVATFGLEHFDIVVGNPPYNANGTLGTGNTIWSGL